MQLMPNKLKRPIAGASESNQRIYNFLKERPVGVLATVDPNGNPHAATIYYSVDEDFSIVFMTKQGTKKHDNLLHNNHLVLVVYEPFTQTTAQITGIAEDITYTPEAEEVYGKITHIAEQTSEAGIPPISKLLVGSYVAYRLRPVQIRMASFIRPDPGGYDIYETIEFPYTRTN